MRRSVLDKFDTELKDIIQLYLYVPEKTYEDIKELTELWLYTVEEFITKHGYSEATKERLTNNEWARNKLYQLLEREGLTLPVNREKDTS